MALLKRVPLKEKPASLPSFEFLKALKASCAWWLKETPSHPSFSSTQRENWMDFCHKVLGCETPEALKDLIDLYLEPVTFPEKAFFTGYYEPLLRGSLEPSKEFCIPLYELPDDKKYSRKAIREGALRGQKLELAWVSDAVDAFFLEIQGSGRIELPEGRFFRVGYAGQNGYPYIPIGRVLLEEGAISKDQLNMQSIKAWLRDHPHRQEEVLQKNESYVFFKELPVELPLSDMGKGDELCALSGPLGTQKIPLSPWMSVACDGVYWPFGVILQYAIESEESLQGFALTQDTGGAIKGPLRFDLFCGFGEHAEHTAGMLKNEVDMSAYLPKDRKISKHSYMNL